MSPKVLFTQIFYHKTPIITKPDKFLTNSAKVTLLRAIFSKKNVRNIGDK